MGSGGTMMHRQRVRQRDRQIGHGSDLRRDKNQNDKDDHGQDGDKNQQYSNADGGARHTAGLGGLSGWGGRGEMFI